MQRGLLYQLDSSSPYSEPAGWLDQLIEEVLLAEELGLASVWCLPGAGEAGNFRLGAIEIWLAALASRTERVRLGWAVAGMTPPDRPPIRVAEQAASLDIASKGRLDVGVLLGDEAETSREKQAEGAAPWDEGLRMWVEMWDRPKFSWTSPRFEVPPVDVLPKPVQHPHPPIWVVGWSVAHAERAGRSGAGLLDVSGGADETLEMHRDAYHAARGEAEPEDLLCISAFAAALDWDALSPGNAAKCDAEGAERIERWAGLEFDHAIVRISSLDGDRAQSFARIRALSAPSKRTRLTR